MSSLVTKYSVFINKIIRDANDIALPSALGTPSLKPHYFLGKRLCHLKRSWEEMQNRKKGIYILSTIVYAIMSMIYANNICKTIRKNVCGVYDSQLL